MRFAWVLAALAISAMAAAGCIPQRGANPIEVFSEQHYAQSFRSQEPPRLAAVAGAEVFTEVGPRDTLEVADKRQRPYDPGRAEELFAVNCSVCHGDDGRGDGPLVPFLISPDSYYARQNDGQTYPSPPDLLQTRERIDEDAVFNIITGGINVMPKFGLLLTEEERWDIVRYIFDREDGLGR